MIRQSIIGYEIRDWMQICSDHVLNDIIYQLHESEIVCINLLIYGKIQKSEVGIVVDMIKHINVLQQNYNCHLHEAINDEQVGIICEVNESIGHQMELIQIMQRV